jgi:hypothetical protein
MLMKSKDLVRVLQTIGLSIHVCCADIDNSVGVMGIKPSEEEVAAVAVTLASIGMGDAPNGR